MFVIYKDNSYTYKYNKMTYYTVLLFITSCIKSMQRRSVCYALNEKLFQKVGM